MDTDTANAFDNLTAAIAQEREAHDALVEELKNENRKLAARIRELEGALRSITSEAEGASNFLRNEFAGFVSIDTAQRLESCSRITRRVLGGAK